MSKSSKDFDVYNIPVKLKYNAIQAINEELLWSQSVKAWNQFDLELVQQFKNVKQRLMWNSTVSSMHAIPEKLSCSQSSLTVS